MRRLSLTLVTVALILNTAGVAGASPTLVTQSFALEPGWNAIHLQVDPDDGDANSTVDAAPASVFALPQISVVWNHPSPSVTAQFITNPDDIGFNEPGWRVYSSGAGGGSAPPAFLTNLYSTRAGQVYLVKLEGAQARTLHVQGRPQFRPAPWQPRTFNLLGFYVDPGQPETFASLLGLDGADNPVIYALNGGNRWQRLAQGAHAIVEPGKGYWISNDGSLDESGPLSVSGSGRDGLAFLGNVSVRELVLTLRDYGRSSTATLSVSGNVPLHYLAGYHAVDNTPRWVPLIGSYNVPLKGSQEANVRLGVPRAGLTSTVEGILTIRAAGSLIQLPLRAEPSRGKTGLWAGVAVLDRVSVATSTTPSALEATPAPMIVKLLMHVDASNQARLLKQVYVLTRDNAQLAAGDDVVLVANDACISRYQPLSLTNREGVGYRLSSSSLDFAGTSVALGSFSDTELTGEVVLDSALPTHPMRHAYHVQHDDRDNATGTVITGDDPKASFRDEVWTVRRNLKLTVDTQPAPSPDNGLGVLVGSYGETITGLHKQPIHVRGRFELRRVVEAPTLIETCP